VDDRWHATTCLDAWNSREQARERRDTVSGRRGPATIAVANFEARHDKEQNLTKMERFIADAAASQAQLVAFPEGALQGYPSGTETHNSAEFLYHYNEAETIPGPATERIHAAAREHDLIVVFGMTEIAGTLGPAGLLFNSVAVVGPQGLLGVYRKVHTGDIEKAVWHRGVDYQVIDTPIGKIGPFICYDVVFPECTRILSLRGAEILIMSTAWMPNDPDSPAVEAGYDLFTRARALENQVWLVVSDQAGRDPDSGITYLGQSRIINPNGEVVLELGAGEELGLLTIDVEGEILRARAGGWWGQVFLRDRAPETYGTIADAELYAPRLGV
jgi:predicted amidohydrolase